MSTSVLEALPGKLDMKNTYLVFSIYTVVNLLFRRCTSRAVKHAWFSNIYLKINLPKRIFLIWLSRFWCTSAVFTPMEHCKQHKDEFHLLKCGVINDIKLFGTVYCRIYCCKCLTLSNQTLHFKIKCIRILYIVIAIWGRFSTVICVSHILAQTIFCTFPISRKSLFETAHEIIVL